MDPIILFLRSRYIPTITPTLMGLQLPYILCKKYSIIHMIVLYICPFFYTGFNIGHTYINYGRR